MTKKFGKHEPKIDYRTLRFKDYLSPTLPPPPTAYSGLDRVAKELSLADPISLFPMDGNDQYGDCTIAALGHAVTAYRAMCGQRHIPTEKSLVALYFKLTGGPDNGLNMLDVVNYWRKHSVSGDKILAFAKIDRARHDLIKHAIHMFGGVYLGFQCQENVGTDFDAGRPWTPGRLTQDGHAVYAVGYDPDSVEVLTWGGRQKGTWAWWDECVDEAYLILPPEARKPEFAPGFNLKQLQDDVAQVTKG